MFIIFYRIFPRRNITKHIGSFWSEENPHWVNYGKDNPFPKDRGLGNMTLPQMWIATWINDFEMSFSRNVVT